MPREGVTLIIELNLSPQQVCVSSLYLFLSSQFNICGTLSPACAIVCHLTADHHSTQLLVCHPVDVVVAP